MSASLSISTTPAVDPVTALDLSQHSDSEDSSIPITPCSIDSSAKRFSAIDAAAPTTTTAVDVGLTNDLHQRDQDYDAPAGLLKFADVPGQLSHLPFTPGSTDNSSTRAPDPNSISSSSKNTISTNPSQPSSPLPAALRKTSPGLAARLKALGFGATKYPTVSTSPQFDHIGRLDEEHLRELDEKHQAGSVTSIITRRGRPWKGVYPKGTAAGEPELDVPEIKTDDTSPIVNVLPEIETPDPLDMDTYKYRLPDHTNGNGTKVTLDTRREHLERSTAPPTPDEATVPPPPPPKDTPPATTPAPTTPPNDFQPQFNTYFTPSHTRPGSIYTLSRVSFANQLAQLTSLQIPDSDSLASQVAAIPTAQHAAKALINAADQIRSWISKASEVVDGLDSDDDVEWAAAGGREGLAEVENAIARFEGLVNAYVCAIEQLQNREDIANVPLVDLNQAVAQMEAVIKEWEKIRRSLQIVRGQVEIAMEWEELWNNVLGDIQGEMDELSRLVFEMEERRHKSLMAAASGDSVDIGDLETIVEEHPPARLQAPNRYSMPPAFPVSPGSPGTPTLSQDDSSLLALFARMQPLRASLDFLPMRLAVFETRAERSFPTACDELMMRHEGLDASYKKLEKDAESLRKELGEDRWVIVFRGVGRQAQKMHESVERSLLKLKEAVDSGLHLTNQPAMLKKLESYEAKKTHYGSAIERVLGIIDKGVSDRLTVNGEILRLHTDMQARWEALKFQMREAEVMIEDIQAERSQQLRDSISSMLSNDVSTAGSGRETPGSSPPSSVIMSSLGLEPYTPTSKPAKARPANPTKARTIPTNRRHSSLPAPTSHLGRKPGFSRLSTVAHPVSTPPITQSRRPTSRADNRPRWNASVNTRTVDTGHNFKPLTLTTPSPYAKRSPATQRSVSSLTPGSGSRLPTLRSPATRAGSQSPRVSPRVSASPRTERPDDTPTRPGNSRLSFRDRLSSPGPYSQQATKPRLSTHASASSVEAGRRSSLQATRPSAADLEPRSTRPASSQASSRRSSVLPQTKAKEGETGRSSPQAIAGARTAMRKSAPLDPNKPRWRH